MIKQIIKRICYMSFPMSIGLIIWYFSWNSLPEVGSSVKTTLTRFKNRSHEHVISERVDPYYSFSDKFSDFIIPSGIFGGFFVFGGILILFRGLDD